MKTRFTALTLCILLSGCANQAYQVRDQYYHAGMKEGNAWKIAFERMDKECPHGTEGAPLPRNQSLKRAGCIEKIVAEEVAPNAFKPTYLARLMMDQRQVAIDYKNGKIDRDEANLQQQKNHIEYLESLDNLAQQDVSKAIQADAHLQQQQQQYFQSLSQKAHEAEIETQRDLEAKRPKTTNCRSIGSSINCTTW